MQFFEYSPKLKGEWDDFMIRSSYGSVHQVSDWGDFQSKIPGREEVLGFGIKNGKNEILAATWCVRMQTGFLGKCWYYSARGPVFDPQKDTEAGILILKKTAEILQKKGGIFWRMDPYFKNEDWEKIKNKNFLEFHLATQNYQPTDTLEIDLILSVDLILEQMKRRGRNGISRAQKNGIQIEIIENGSFTEKDLDDFYRLNQETTSRDGFFGHTKDYYKNFLKCLKNHAVLFFASVAGKRIATAISTFCGDKAIYYFGASTSDLELSNLKAPTLLQWEMIKYGKSKNCQTYDFLGISPEDDPQHVYAGISQFKHGFGGNRKVYAPGKEVVLNKFWYFVYRMGKKISRCKFFVA